MHWPRPVFPQQRTHLGDGPTGIHEVVDQEHRLEERMAIERERPAHIALLMGTVALCTLRFMGAR